MKTKFKTRFKGVCFAFFAAVVFLLFLINGGGMFALNSISASAASGDLIEIERYDVDMTVRKDRKIEVEETITVEFLQSGLTMFYRSLPTDGARYTDFVASCEGNDAFHYYVDDNPDVSGFIDVNCVGNANKGKTWTYDISYVMEQGASVGSANGMIVDVVGFGWTVPLHNVSVTVHFPAAISEADYTVYTDVFGEETGNEVHTSLSDDGKTLTMETELLDLVYSSRYREIVAGGLTLEFTLPKGTLRNYTITRIFTEDMWKIALGVLAAVGVSAALLILMRKKRDMITVVNIKAPDEMDPMKMGKWLDGAVDNEDVTSMLYYFANKGYLQIDLTDENDPLLIARMRCLPDNAPVYEKTLFNGLFKKAQSVRVSEAAGTFYDAMNVAKRQVPFTATMYEKKSVLGYIGGALIGVLIGFFIPFLMGLRLGGGYRYVLGILFALPVVAIALIGYVTENYRYKWKDKRRKTMLVIQGVIAVVCSVIFIVFFAGHLMMGWEKFVLCLGVFGSCFITQGALSRSEKYLDVLGEILGFKDFIVVTEEDKIKVMLEENPELYYKVLPYAQVLGVTDEWENKFRRLTVEPPQWCYGTHMTAFDYYIIHRSLNIAMRRSIAAELAKRARQNSGGGRVGRSGGGGSFGGRGGGGFGGGGGGAR